jgi:universal stress protein E
MDQLKSILVVIERGEHVRQVLAKACVLTRHFGASLELFLCDAEHAYTLQHAYDTRGTAEARASCLMDARRYLEALRLSVAATNLPISIDAACESPLYEGVLQKVLRSCPDLAVLSASLGNGGGSQGLSASAWQVIRTCPVPVMLTRGVPWHPEPRFAAAVDVSSEETPGLARAILQTSEHLARTCEGRLDVLYCERAGCHSDDHEQHDAALRELTREFHLAEDHVHMLEGEPAKTLPRFAADHGYDLLVLGALTHQKALAALVGTVTAKLVDSLECDFVLVKPGTYSAPDVAADARVSAPAGYRVR